jgi:hypothetical protein
MVCAAGLAWATGVGGCGVSRSGVGGRGVAGRVGASDSSGSVLAAAADEDEERDEQPLPYDGRSRRVPQVSARWGQTIRAGLGPRPLWLISRCTDVVHGYLRHVTQRCDGLWRDHGRSYLPYASDRSRLMDTVPKNFGAARTRTSQRSELESRAGGAGTHH